MHSVHFAIVIVYCSFFAASLSAVVTHFATFEPLAALTHLAFSLGVQRIVSTDDLVISLLALVLPSCLKNHLIFFFQILKLLAAHIFCIAKSKSESLFIFLAELLSMHQPQKSPSIPLM